MCESTECAGCAYSKFPALFHSGPRRECYRRFFVRLLPLRVVARWVRAVLWAEAAASVRPRVSASWRQR